MEKIDVSIEISDDKVKEIVDEVILEYGNEKGLSVREKYRLQKEIYDSIRGLDILEELLEDKNITEIMINGPDNILHTRHPCFPVKTYFVKASLSVPEKLWQSLHQIQWY